MIRYIKKILLWLSAAIALLLVAALLFTYVWGDKLTDIILNELNKEIKGEIVFSGDIEFSVIEKFPYASVTFNNIRAYSSSNFNRTHHPINTDIAVEANKIYIQLNLFDLIRKRYKISKITFENAVINIYADNNGEYNFMYYQPTKDSVKSKLDIEITNLSLINVKTTYWDSRNNLFFNGFFQNLDFSGKFADKDFTIESAADFHCYKFSRDKEIFIYDKSLNYTAQIDVKNDNYIIKKLEVGHQDILISAEGNLLYSEATKNVNLKINAEDASLKILTTLIPLSFKQKLDNFSFDGFLNLNASVAGNITDAQMPRLELQYKISNGKVIYKNYTFLVSTTGTVKTSDISNVSKYNLESGQTALSVGESMFKGAFSLNDFDKLTLSCLFQSNINLEDLNRFKLIESKYAVSGSAKGGIDFSSSLKEFDFYKVGTYNLEAKLNLSNVSFKDQDNKSNEISYLSGGLQIKQNSLYLDCISLKAFKAKLQISGEIDNLPQYLSPESAPLYLKLDVVADTLDFNFVQDKSNKSNTPKTNSEPFRFPENIRLTSNFSISELRHEKLVVNNIKSKLVVLDNKILLENLNCNIFKGSLFANTVATVLPNGNISISGENDIKNIDVPSIFQAFNNFDQDFLKDTHLKGLLSSSTNFTLQLSNDFKFITNTLKAQTDLVVNNGALINFEPVLELSKFVEISELKNINFSSLKNSVVIRNDSVYIPQMDINTNAFNIGVSGVQSFDTDFDYSIMLYLNEFLSKKKNNQKEKEFFGELEDDGLGRIKLFLRIFGNPDSFKIQWDKKNSRQNNKVKIQEEKSELIKIFKEEFNKNKESDSDENLKDENDFNYDFDDI
ncbi:MAG: hypothetical protein IPO21_12395 [Bacteroidales bacterium]|nr:hypothetical protein [Bacteroidales bacterium]